ncbi:alpha/beta hydrolase fold domain-containing protein [Kineosporia babensis]|uniref:Alpha/beta hydrolase n=1 Tax=Kineosporia babensis TaxID=499548 RepID=A0A9X1NIS3_9ACTN|nr:alpha/beta hydrolase fold domain-containing protein [Kineosporia babensis]MCD5314344.1 alpha/beta hydrolase [Kineosporia babensis]
MAGNVDQPGRLGDPDRNLKTDPRTDVRLARLLGQYGLDQNAQPASFGPDAPREQLLEYVQAAEDGNAQFFDLILDGLDSVPGLQHHTETIVGSDGNEISLYITRPGGVSQDLPALLYLHGGGMVMLKASDPIYVRLADELAATGLIVITPEFRNGAGALGPHPFPAGLDDCAAALDWVHENRSSLGISRLIVAGESGGANLALATTIRAKRTGRLAAVDGVYVLCPFIYGQWGRDEQERREVLPSTVENDGYMNTCHGSSMMAEVYDPGAQHAEDPLCWPYHATVEDLSGLPPHAMSVNELDLLRDEGLAYHRRLLEAGVESSVRTVPGFTHAADLMFRAAIPEEFFATIRSVHRFAVGND